MYHIATIGIGRDLTTPPSHTTLLLPTNIIALRPRTILRYNPSIVSILAKARGCLVGHPFFSPVKRRQALLGSNLPRDNRMQVALNDAPGENSSNSRLFPPSRILLFKPSCPCLKEPNTMGARSASTLSSNVR